MRVNDLAPPVLTPHVLPPDAPLARWPVKLRVALERLPQAAYVWDDEDPDVTWDDTTPERVWDAAFIESGFTDAVCDFHVCSIDAGDADELYLVPPVQCTVTLANGDGAWSLWTADGRLAYFAPGRRVCVWAVDAAGVSWWLFSGRVASWTVNADSTVTVVAFDGLAAFAAEAGPAWTPGSAGQKPLDRIRSIAASIGYPDPIGGDTGDVALTATASSAAPLDECQVAALSDGGQFYGDADGRLVYRNRLWRAGRTDQTTVRAISDNVCTVPVIVWNPEAAADDERLVTDVRLVNTAGLVATATAYPDAASWANGMRFRLAHPDPDRWTTQAEGNALATYLVGQQSTPRAALRSAEVYALDPNPDRDLWPFVLDTRRGDLVQIVHAFTNANGGTSFLDVFAVVLTVSHEITPDEWVMRTSMSRTVDWRQVAMWDRAAFTWDDPNPDAVWRF